LNEDWSGPCPVRVHLRSKFKLTQHGEIPKFCGFGQKLIMTLKPGLLIRQFQMNLEILAGSPILIEVKYVGIIIADVKMIVDAAGLRPRPTDKTAQKFDKFCALFRSSVQRSCEGATWFHDVFWLAFHHASNIGAMWFFNLEGETFGCLAIWEKKRWNS
jgi:hypothetical protein